MIKAFKHKQTGRYLACISRKHRDVETTKMVEDAIKFDIATSWGNYHRFVKNYQEQLKQFTEVTL